MALAVMASDTMDIIGRLIGPGTAAAAAMFAGTRADRPADAGAGAGTIPAESGDPEKCAASDRPEEQA
jgi:hypothetical protein